MLSWTRKLSGARARLTDEVYWSDEFPTLRKAGALRRLTLSAAAQNDEQEVILPEDCRGIRVKSDVDVLVDVVAGNDWTGHDTPSAIISTPRATSDPGGVVWAAEGSRTFLLEPGIQRVFLVADGLGTITIETF